jgi:hypothetical protein
MHGGDEDAYGVSAGNLKERDHLEDLCADGRIILNYILRT